MAIKLNKETTEWVDIDSSSSKKLKAATEAARKAQSAVSAMWRECEAIKTAELVAKGELPADMEPFYSHKFGQWRVAAEKADGSIIGQKRRTAKGSRERRTI